MNKDINNPRHQALIKWLRTVRNDRGLTVREFGELLGEPFQLVHKIEKGRRNISACELVTYCEALEVEPKEAIDIMTNVQVKK